MPYKNIHWVKLEKRLLNDPRFFLMSERAQLIYIKSILLCAHFNNKVPRAYPVLKELLRVTYDETTLDSTIEEIRKNFPKFLAHKDFYYIKGFKQMHNWISPRSSQGTPKDAEDKIRIDKIRKDKIYICDFFKEMYLKETEVPYPINYGKDRKIMGVLLETYEVETLKELITEFFESARNPNEWWADKLSIGVFKSVIPQIIGKLRKK